MVIALFSLMTLSQESLAAKTKMPKQFFGSQEPSAKEIERGIAQGYKVLTRLSKGDSNEAFQNKERELRFKLADPVLPQSYKNKMNHKIDVLAGKREKAVAKKKSVEKDAATKPEKKVKAEKTVKKAAKKAKSPAAKKKRVIVSKEERDAETRRIFKEILAEHPEYKEDSTGLADAVLERKIELVREREFLQTEFDSGVDKLYEKALTKYQNKSFKESKKDFVEVEKLAPNYKSTRNYLKKLSNVTSDSNGGTR